MQRLFQNMPEIQKGLKLRDQLVYNICVHVGTYV